MTLGKALWRALDRFFRSFLIKRGYRDGFTGYFAAVCAGFYQIISFAKYWHRTQGNSQATAEKKEGGASPEKLPGFGREHPTSGSRKLSVVILARNAAHKIPRCLASVQFADEIIVVDGGSTDETVSLCERFGAQVIHRPATDNFSEERNLGSQAAQGKWILQLDADEVVTPEFQERLRELTSLASSHAAYKFRRKNFFLGFPMRFGGWEHDSLHLFRKGKARYTGRVHERLVVEGTIGSLPVGVDHYPFQTLEEFLDRQNRYTSLEARERIESQKGIASSTVFFQTTFKPFKLFWKVWVRKQGFRNGRVGFLFAGLFAFVHFLKWAKAWELFHEQTST